MNGLAMILLKEAEAMNLSAADFQFALDWYTRGMVAEREACARACEARAEDRFNEHGTREPDTGATYYGARCGEEYEARDEEDEACALAIRARSNSNSTTKSVC